MDGYADRHNYYAALVSVNGIGNDLEALWGAIPRSRRGTKPIIDDERERLEHGYIVTEERYALQDNLVIAPGYEGSSQPAYQYDVYFAKIKLADSCYVLAAFPFRRLGRYLFRHVIESRVGSTLTFYGIDLRGVVDAIKENRHRGGKVRIVGYDAQVTADPMIDGLELRGDDAIHSRLYDLLLAEFPEKGFLPIKCTFLYEDFESLRIRVHCDRFGNFRFWLSSKAGNLRALFALIDYFQSEGMLRGTSSTPFERILLDLREGDPDE